MSEDRRDRVWSTGDTLHIIQIAVLLISIGIVYEKFDANSLVTAIHTQQLNRIEHYLSAHDPKYWDESKKDE
jgi:hypothetical protein